MKKLVCAALFLVVTALPTFSHALSDEVKLDMLKTKLVQQLEAKDYDGALETMQELKGMGATLPASFEYFEGKALFESGNKVEAYYKFSHYADTQGKNGKYYKETIAYLVQAEEAKKNADAAVRRRPIMDCIEASKAYDQYRNELQRLEDRLDSKNDECEDLGSKMWEYHNKGNNHKADYYMEKRRECTDKADSYLERWNSFKTSEPRDTYNAFCAEENSWDKEDIKAACQSSSTSFCNRHK